VKAPALGLVFALPGDAFKGKTLRERALDHHRQDVERVERNAAEMLARLSPPKPPPKGGT
jgi:hypothetical protein